MKWPFAHNTIYSFLKTHFVNFIFLILFISNFPHQKKKDKRFNAKPSVLLECYVIKEEYKKLIQM